MDKEKVKELLGKLKERLKADGLDLAEDAAEDVLHGILDTVVEYAKATETPLDDLIVLPLVKELRKSGAKRIDKIDGKEG